MRVRCQVHLSSCSRYSRSCSTAASMVTLRAAFLCHASALGLLTCSIARPSAAQLPLPAGIRTRPAADTLVGRDGAAAANRDPLSPSGPRLAGRSIGRAVFVGEPGGLAGLFVDYGVCKQHKRRGSGGLVFDPCFLYAAEGTVTGWIGGALVGATYGAATGARRRGCPAGAAWWRAAVGAGIGGLPGALIAARRYQHVPPRRSVVLLSAPLLAGVGAAAAVAGCHR